MIDVGFGLKILEDSRDQSWLRCFNYQYEEKPKYPCLVYTIAIVKCKNGKMYYTVEIIDD